MGMQVVWFKRDLRASDHAPLVAAAARGSVLPVYIVEPEQWRQPDASGRHWAVAAEALLELREALAHAGQPLVVRTGPAVEVLRELHAAHGIDTLWSHEETGNGWSYARDLRVAAWLRAQGIAWQEIPSAGVQRGLRRRARWASTWEQRLAAPPLLVPALESLPGLEPGVIPSASDLDLPADVCPGRQRGGRSRGERALATFLAGRGKGYMRAMSSPLTAESGCSRLSVALATGTLSMREVVHAIRRARADGGPVPPRDLASMEKRLHWHCHFIQKLETEPEIELRNMHRGFDGMREDDFDADRFSAWSRGETGWPFVDACMRSLAATGWINFRMRAMLVSVASYQLWLHWPEPAQHLARLFTDYEPGIHYPQVQMQSGVTGINIPRMYNPVKQSRDQDPRGEFIRRWLPELAGVADEWIHTPWLMGGAQQRAAGLRLGQDYPLPVRDHEQAAREARARLGEWRRRPGIREQALEVLDRHGSRAKRGKARRAGPRRAPEPLEMPATPAQADLF